MILKYKKILTFFAHPDDETLAAGATINKLSRNGCHVYAAIPSTGINARKNILNEENLQELKNQGLRLQNKILQFHKFHLFLQLQNPNY